MDKHLIVDDNIKASFLFLPVTTLSVTVVVMPLTALHPRSSVICCSSCRSNSIHGDSLMVIIEVVLFEVYLVFQFVYMMTSTMRVTMNWTATLPMMGGTNRRGWCEWRLRRCACSPVVRFPIITLV